jgi:hypothetical protein
MTIALQNPQTQEPRNTGMESIVNWIRLNVVTRTGRWFHKRRNAFGKRILPAANWFFRTCHVPVSFRCDPQDWQEWEIRCFRMLNPQYLAYSLDAHTVCEEALPGESLWVHLRRGTLQLRMIQAAGKEYRRAHSLWNDVYGGRWSHGDGATRNTLYDETTGRARLIDFELLHDPKLPSHMRQADDLMAFLLDLAAFTSRRRWRKYALAFLAAHGDPEVIQAVRRRLEVPRGTALVWWKIRTHFVATGKIARRLEKLARAIDQGALATAGSA